MGDEPDNSTEVDLLHDLIEPLHLVDNAAANAAHDLAEKLRTKAVNHLTGGLPWWLLLFFAYEILTDKERR